LQTPIVVSAIVILMNNPLTVSRFGAGERIDPLLKDGFSIPAGSRLSQHS
jgi:hypothetical protein